MLDRRPVSKSFVAAFLMWEGVVEGCGEVHWLSKVWVLSDDDEYFVFLNILETSLEICGRVP